MSTVDPNFDNTNNSVFALLVIALGVSILLLILSVQNFYKIKHINNNSKHGLLKALKSGIVPITHLGLSCLLVYINIAYARNN
jgi:hypothetical protein